MHDFSFLSQMQTGLIHPVGVESFPDRGVPSESAPGRREHHSDACGRGLKPELHARRGYKYRARALWPLWSLTSGHRIMATRFCVRLRPRFAAFRLGWTLLLRLAQTRLPPSQCVGLSLCARVSSYLFMTRRLSDFAAELIVLRPRLKKEFIGLKHLVGFKLEDHLPNYMDSIDNLSSFLNR